MILDSRSSSVFGALAILAPMAGTRVMAVGAIGGRPSPLGDNALWQPLNCPPVSTFATFGRPTNALWAFSPALGGRHIFDSTFNRLHFEFHSI